MPKSDVNPRGEIAVTTGLLAATPMIPFTGSDAVDATDNHTSTTALAPPAPVTVTVPVYIPAASPALLAVTLIVPGPLPELLSMLNHAALDFAAVQLLSALVVLVNVMFLDAGAGPPGAAKNVSIPGLTPTGATSVARSVTPE